jgi:hypothetical protein
LTIRKRRPGPILLAAALLTAALPTAAATASSLQASKSPSSLPTWAHGSITGAGPHSGVRLLLVEWPSGSALTKARVGQKIPLRVLGKATSTSSGSYTLRSGVTLSKGIHNLRVLARSGVAVGTFAFPREIVRRGRALVAVAVNGSASASTGPVRANIHMMALPKAEQLTARRHPSIPYCPPFTYKRRDLGKKWVKIGGLWAVGIPDGEFQMTYSEGATTSIGIGVDVPFTGGSFQVGGTEAETKTGGEGFTPQFGVEEAMQTYFRFVKVSVCGIGPGSGYTDVEPGEWATGQNEVFAKPPGTVEKNCGGHVPHLGTFQTTDEKAGTFSAGVNLKKEIGINLSAQSGYNKNVGIFMTMGTGGGNFCGTNALPPKAQWVVMDQTKFGNPGP